MIGPIDIERDGFDHSLEFAEEMELYPVVNVDLEEEFSLTEFPMAVVKALRNGLENVAIRLAVTFGYRDENQLTNLVFFGRHPERSGRKLQKSGPGFKALSQEWLDIRAQVVRPALEGKSTPTSSQTGPTSGLCRVSGDCVQCGSCQACERRLRAAPTPHLMPVPTEMRYSSNRPISLDATALAAYQRLYQAARTAGIRAPYLKIHSGYRDYDTQAGLWRGRLLYLFNKRGCNGSSLPCIASAIDRTTRALRSVPVPHSQNTWVDRFVQELKQSGCSLPCDPRSVVSDLRKGTAPPGRSPHHTGRAVDIHVGGGISTAASNVQFQRKQAAYRWLVCNSARFGFYPYNREPWHWEYNPT